MNYKLFLPLIFTAGLSYCWAQSTETDQIPSSPTIAPPSDTTYSQPAYVDQSGNLKLAPKPAEQGPTATYSSTVPGPSDSTVVVTPIAPQTITQQMMPPPTPIQTRQPGTIGQPLPNLPRAGSQAPAVTTMPDSGGTQTKTSPLGNIGTPPIPPNQNSVPATPVETDSGTVVVPVPVTQSPTDANIGRSVIPGSTTPGALVNQPMQPNRQQPTFVPTPPPSFPGSSATTVAPMNSNTSTMPARTSPPSP